VAQDPDHDPQQVDVMPTSPELWSVIIPLWTGAEGRSDLLLEATVEDRVEGPVVEVRSVHVL
jgi:hypothetical protein